MGHWSEGLVDEVVREVGGAPDRRRVTEILNQVGHGLEALAGRSFQPARRSTSVIESSGLPFVDIPDLNVGTLESAANAWEIPDPVNPAMAAVLQLTPLENVVTACAPAADALWIAGHHAAAAAPGGGLSGEYVIEWLGTFFDREQRMELLRRVMDPAVRFHVPILGVGVAGWWIQIARRLVWVTNDTEDEGRLLERLIDVPMSDGGPLPLAAAEPILIVVPMTSQPARWAFAARIWPENVAVSAERPWSTLAPAIHGHGIPTITVDAASSPQEVACQVVLKAFWHRYLDGDRPALANAVAQAYPRQVAYIQRATRDPDATSAATRLLAQLVQPGFDPAMGAEKTRRYVRRKASIVVMEHRKEEAPERYPWTQAGITERHYYKLLPLFAEKVNGRYVIDDYDDLVRRVKEHLDREDRTRTVRALAIEVLMSRGFSEAAARKWLQRHPAEKAVDARPRGS